MDYQLQEGSIVLPEGFQDRTVNMFVLGATMPAPLSLLASFQPRQDDAASVDTQQE